MTLVSRDTKGWNCLIMEIENFKLNIESILGENYLKRFRIFYPQTLFPPDFGMLKDFRCPICFKKLYWNLGRSIARCKSVRKDKFFIRKDVLDRLVFIFK